MIALRIDRSLRHDLTRQNPLEDHARAVVRVAYQIHLPGQDQVNTLHPVVGAKGGLGVGKRQDAPALEQAGKLF